MAKSKTNNEESVINAEAHLEDEWYDLLPIEMKLIKCSLGLGLVLLVVFVVVFRIL